MNKQRKVLVTITYNEMGIIIDTKAEEVAHPETEKRTPQTEQNVSDSDLISRKATIDAADEIIARDESGNNDVVKAMTAWKEYIKDLPSAQPEIIRCGECKWLGEPSPFIKDKYDCKIVDRLVNVDSFCSWAERREE